MSVTTAIGVPNTTARPASSLRRTTLTVGVGAAAVTTAVAAGLDAAGVSFAIDGESIPMAGFAQMTLLGTVIGGLLLSQLNRRSSAARTRFIQVTALLTALSCLPSVALPDDFASKIALVVTHLVAAAIVVPALVRHANTES
jgi:hypothetical protein